jgi:hypothetical protein
MSTPTIDELRLTVAFHREALAKAETQLRDLEEPPHTRPIPQSEVKKRAIAIENRTAFKLHWKMAVERGLVENVQGILNECADYFCHDKEDLGAEIVTAAKTRFGKAGSLQRQEFTLLVIQYLKHNGSFIDEEGGFDTFEDTAGGCDEVTQDAAMYLINNPEWKV